VTRRLYRIAILVALGLGGFLAIASPPPGEYQIKAAYLLNFARYMEWPAMRLPAGAPLRLCVLGRDPFGGALGSLDGRQVHGHEVRVRLVDSVEQATECHIVFVSDSEERRMGLILRGLALRGVLTVSDIEGFAEAGGCIGLVTEDERVRFDINQASLQRDSLRASSQLLRLGRNLIGTKGP
jgi:hypothetical protein